VIGCNLFMRGGVEGGEGEETGVLGVGLMCFWVLGVILVIFFEGGRGGEIVGGGEEGKGGGWGGCWGCGWGLGQ